MERRVLGKTGMAVSALGLGSSEIGYESASQRQISELINRALDAGLNVIDTAACYGDAEEMIGRAVSHRRGDYFILTKCGHSSGLRYSDWTPALLEPSIARSLKRLRTDCLDLVQLHSCSEEALRAGDIVAALRRARDKGLTRFIGYSGDGAAAVYAARCREFDTLQISVSIADQEAIDGAIAEARRRGLGVIAKRPIANAVWIPRRDGLDYYYRTYRERLKALDYDFLRGGPEAAAVALRFAIAVPGVHTAIVGTTKASRWAQNAAIVETGPLAQSAYDAIRERWRTVARPDWVGQR